VAAAGEGATAQGQCDGGCVAGDRVAVGILDRDGHSGADRRAGAGVCRLLDERHLGGSGGGVGRGRGVTGVGGGGGVGGAEDVAAGVVDDQVAERGDAGDGLRGNGGGAVGEGAVAEGQGDRGRVGADRVADDVLHRDDELAQRHAGGAGGGLLEVGEPGGRG